MLLNSSTGRLWLRGFLCVALLVSLVPAAAGEGAYLERDALIVGVSEEGLGRWLRDALFEGGPPIFEGVKNQPERGIYDLRYRLDLTEPEVRLGQSGELHLSLDIREADLSIGRIERRFGGRVARCENAGVRVESERPVEVSMDVQLSIEDHDLHIVPQEMTLFEHKKDYRLIKPSRCRNTPLPKWLLWWIGKSRLRHRLAELDETLLARAGSRASRLNDEDGFLQEVWTADPERPDSTLHLYPHALDTRDGKLRLRFSGATGSRQTPATGGSEQPGWMDPLPSGSFVAVSESFVNQVLSLRFSNAGARTIRPRGHLSKLMRSDALNVLFPGLADLETTEGLALKLRLDSAPRLEFLPGEDSEGATLSPAIIAIEIRGLALEVWQEESAGEKLLGTLTVESGRVAVRPRPNPVEGISFDLVENTWRISSEGIEINDSLFEATLQELVFGEIFETTYDPLRATLRTTQENGFRAGRVSTLDRYLVIELLPPTLLTVADGRDPR